MHCDVIQPALPIAGFLVVLGATVLVGQRRSPRSRIRVGAGIGCLLLATILLATLTVRNPSVGCEPLPRTAGSLPETVAVVTSVLHAEGVG